MAQDNSPNKVGFRVWVAPDDLIDDKHLQMLRAWAQATQRSPRTTLHTYIEMLFARLGYRLN